jgi:response regulator RpfG family c-di-GMP phosphodiesterase
MISESFKDIVFKLSVDELKEAQFLIAELIESAHLLHDNKKGQVVVFAADEDTKSDERRTEKRFGIGAEGVYSVLGEDDLAVLKETPLRIIDISQHGIKFETNNSLIPSNVLLVKFSLNSINKKNVVYRNPTKKIYVEVRRIIEVESSGDTGDKKYEVGAKSIDIQRVEELRQEKNNAAYINKKLATKEDFRILIVSAREEEAIRLEKLLQILGYSVYRVKQKQQAISLLRNYKCNILVSDMDTARINNFNLLEHIKDEFPGMGIIIEIDKIEEWLDLMPMGVDDFLTSNYDNEECRIVVQNLHKKLLSKYLFGQSSQIRRHLHQGVMVISTNDDRKKLLFNILKQNCYSVYLVNNIEYTKKVLKSYKIDYIFLDTESAGLEGCEFIANMKGEFPHIKSFVISGNLQERRDYLINGVDSFIIETLDPRRILAMLV